MAAVLFVRRERSARYPLLDLTLVAHPLVSSGLAFKAAAGLATAGLGYLVTLQLQLDWRWTPRTRRHRDAAAGRRPRRGRRVRQPVRPRGRARGGPGRHRHRGRLRCRHRRHRNLLTALFTGDIATPTWSASQTAEFREAVMIAGLALTAAAAALVGWRFARSSVVVHARR